MSLPAREASWLLVTTPYLPSPGQDTTLHLLHVGSDATFPSGEDAVLRLAGEVIPWEGVDATHRALTATVEVGWGSTTLPLTLSVGDEEVGAWAPSVGTLFDSDNAWTDVYPVRPTGTWLDEGNWVVNLHPAPGVFHPGLLATVLLSTSDGSEVPIANAYPVGYAFQWATIEVSWADLVGVDTLLIRDRSGGVPLTLPVVQPADSQALLEQVGSAQCGLDRNRLGPSRDRATGILTLLDHDGHPMLVPMSLLDLEIQGATLTRSPVLTDELMDTSFTVEAGDVLGPGQIIVRSVDGAEWGRCDFTVAERPARPVDLASSWATLSRDEMTHAAYQMARLRIGLTDEFGELVGAEAWPTVLLSGGTWVSPLALTDAGSLSGDIGPTDEDDTITITVTFEGKVLETFTVTVTGEAPGDDDSVTPPPSSGGCGGGGAPHTAALLGLLLLLLTLRRRRWTTVASRPFTE